VGAGGRTPKSCRPECIKRWLSEKSGPAFFFVAEKRRANLWAGLEYVNAPRICKVSKLLEVASSLNSAQNLRMAATTATVPAGTAANSPRRQPWERSPTQSAAPAGAAANLSHYPSRRMFRPCRGLMQLVGLKSHGFRRGLIAIAPAGAAAAGLTSEPAIGPLCRHRLSGADRKSRMGGTLSRSLFVAEPQSAARLAAPTNRDTPGPRYWTPLTLNVFH
jgi:hypothetical protein